MMQNDIILFRYHDNPKLIRQRLLYLRNIEPEIPIFGIYGGDRSGFDKATRMLGDLLTDNYLIPVNDKRWKWLHADITYKLWYDHVGKHLNFRYAYIIEWDLLMIGRMKHLYASATNQNIVCTGLIPLEKVEDFWYWTNSQNKPKVESFYKQVSQYYRKPFIKYASLGPGLCAPKSFFEGLIEMKLFEADISDEIKIPVWSQLMDIKPIPNDFYKKWFSYFEMQYFNTNIREIPVKTIIRESKKQNGRRVFHPFRDNTPAGELLKIYHSRNQPTKKASKDSWIKIKTIHPLLYKVHCKMLNATTKPQ
jgi:hypothetical protein